MTGSSAPKRRPRSFGTAVDATVPVMNSLLYAQALAAHHVPFELHIYPQGGHGLSTCDHQTLDEVLSEHEYDHTWLACAKHWLHYIFDK